MPTTTDTCVFCRIAEGTIPADIVFESAATLFFKDQSPKAPVHILGIPRQHLSGISAATPAHADILGELLVSVVEVARQAGVADDGYRVLINDGKNAGQEVPHLHVHILGGEALGPMRC